MAITPRVLLLAVVLLAGLGQCHALKIQKCPFIPTAIPVFPASECGTRRRDFTFSNDNKSNGPLLVSKLQADRKQTAKFVIAPGKSKTFSETCGGMQYYLEARECDKCLRIFKQPYEATNSTLKFRIPEKACNAGSGPATPGPTPKPKPKPGLKTPFDRPNIVVMLVDDIGSQDFGFNGADFIETPVLDRLVKKSLHFVAAWATPLCLTTRALIMTGKLPYETNWFSHKNPPPMDIRNFGTTVGNLAQDAGYKSLIAGKWQIPGRARGYGGYGFDEYFTIRHADNRSEEDIYKDFDGKAAREPDGRLVQDQNRYAHPLIVRNDVVVDTDPKDFSSNMIVDEIRRFMRQTRDDGKKSFVWWPSPLAHKDYDHRTRTPSAWAQMPILNSKGKITGYDRSKASFPKMINYMDTIVGLFIENLKRDDLYNDTLFIFTSDNGSPGIPERERPYKAAVQDERGVLVPVIFHHGGGLIPARETTALFSHADVYATIAGFMKHKVSPARRNSYDFSKFARGTSSKEPRKWVFSYQDGSRMIRTAKHYLNGNNVLFSCPPSADTANCTKVSDPGAVPEANLERKRMLKILNELESKGYSNAGAL